MKARLHESVLRVFTEQMYLNEIQAEDAWSDILTGMKKSLGSERMWKRCMDHLEYPLSVTNITTRNLSDIYKVFDSRNAYFHFQIESTSQEKRISEMIERLAPVRWIEENGRKALKNQACMVVVLDKDENGEPYLISIDIDRVIDGEFANESELDYIMFHHSTNEEGKQLIGLYDSQSYRVFIEDEAAEDGLSLLFENPHTAGKCPARMFISKPLNARVGFSRWSPLGSVISKLKEWTLFDTYKRYADHYASFPMIQIPNVTCSVDGCKDGVIEETFNYTEDGEKYTGRRFTDCPSCAKRETVGPGVIIQKTARATNEDPEVPDTSFIETPVESLKYLDEKLQIIERFISVNSTGVDKLLESEAVNEQQVNGAFESRRNILLNTKKHFDSLYVWIVETAVALYAPNVGIKVHGDFGTEFYLQSEDEVQARFEKAKKIGLPPAEIEMIYKQLMETKYRNDPGKQTRSELIYLLDPMPFDNDEQAKIKFDSGYVTSDEIWLHSNLIALVNRFEREQSPLVDFGKALSMNKRIEAITRILIKYKSNEAEPLRASDQRGRIERGQSEPNGDTQ